MFKPRPRLHRSKIPNIAKELHKETYAHFASGDLQRIESKVCEGMLGSLRKRINLRPANSYLIWRLHKYLSPPKLVSYKAAGMPESEGLKGFGIVQAVVRIHSLQSLQHVKRVQVRKGAEKKMVMEDIVVDARGRELPLARVTEQVDMEGAKETVEYFVIQKMMKRSKEGPWMVWGTAEETTVDKLNAQERKGRVGAVPA